MHKKLDDGKALYFPMFFNLAGRRALVVGGGPVGARRAGILADFGARVVVCAPEGCTAMWGLEQDGSITWNHRPFQEPDLAGSFLVIAATSRESLNDQIVCLCRERGILVNHAGDHTQCDFYFPAIAQKGDLVVGMSSSGRNHELVRGFAAKLREWLRGAGLP